MGNQVKRTTTGGIGLKAMTSFILEMDTSVTFYKGQNLNDASYTFSASGERLKVEKMGNYYAPPPAEPNTVAFPGNAMQSLKVNFPEFNNAKGYWVATTGGNGNAELTLDEGTSNSQSYTLNRTV